MSSLYLDTAHFYPDISYGPASLSVPTCRITGKGDELRQQGRAMSSTHQAPEHLSLGFQAMQLVPACLEGQKGCRLLLPSPK